MVRSVLFLLASLSVAQACEAPPSHSTVSITRWLNEDDQKLEPNDKGYTGTGWFLTPTTLVTVNHVTEPMHLDKWKSLEFQQDRNHESINVRLGAVIGEASQRLSVLVLQHPFHWGDKGYEVRNDPPNLYWGDKGYEVRNDPLNPDEPVVALGYPDQKLRNATGRFVEHSNDIRTRGLDLFELYDGNDRLVLDHGASGSPIFDCQYKVVGVVAQLYTNVIKFMHQTTRLSTPWGSPNISAVPVKGLLQ